MRRSMMTVTALAVLAGSGCYHATIDTGRTPSGDVLEEKWAHSFLGGLVPPSTVDTASRCPNGVAKVETQHSFLNMLAAFLTSGIYSPMTITVQCAAAGGGDEANALSVPENASADAAGRVFQDAVTRSIRTGDAVLVRFE